MRLVLMPLVLIALSLTIKFPLNIWPSYSFLTAGNIDLLTENKIKQDA